MMGHRQVEQAALFYEFSLEEHIPADHLLDGFVELGELRRGAWTPPTQAVDIAIRWLDRVVGRWPGLKIGMPGFRKLARQKSATRRRALDECRQT